LQAYQETGSIFFENLRPAASGFLTRLHFEGSYYAPTPGSQTNAIAASDYDFTLKNATVLNGSGLIGGCPTPEPRASTRKHGELAAGARLTG